MLRGESGMGYGGWQNDPFLQELLSELASLYGKDRSEM